MPLENSNPNKTTNLLLAKAFCERLSRPFKQVLGSSGQSFDGSSDKYNDTISNVSDLQEFVNNSSGIGAVKNMSEKYYEDHLKKSLNGDNKKEDEETINNKIDAALQELILKQKKIKELLDEIEKEDERIRKKASDDIGKTHDSIVGKVEEVESENQNAAKYRLLASLILFGVLDVLNLVAEIAGHFGEVGEKFHEAVKKVVTNPNCMSFFADVNQTLKLDVVAEAVASTPIFEDLNQFAVDAFTSEYLGSITSLGFDAIQGDLADYLLRFAAVVYVINSEVALGKKFDDVDEKIKAEYEKCRIKVKEELEKNEITRAENIIEKETESELGMIYVGALKRAKIDNMSDTLKEDLKKIEIVDHEGIKKNALELLTNESQKGLLYIPTDVKMHEDLEMIAKKNRDCFKEDKKVAEAREELLSKCVEKLDLAIIKNTLITKVNAKKIGEEIDVDGIDENYIKEKKDKLIEAVMKLSVKDGDSIITALAIEEQRSQKIRDAKQPRQADIKLDEEFTQSLRDLILKRGHGSDLIAGERPPSPAPQSSKAENVVANRANVALSMGQG